MLGCVTATPLMQVKNMTDHAAMSTSPLERFGFKFNLGGAHSSRTLMLNELSTLLDYVDSPQETQKGYQAAIETDNCLSKRSTKTRQLTFRHLVDLYALDSQLLVFRALLYFWQRDEASRPLLSLLCAYVRDSLLRASASVVLPVHLGDIVSRQAQEESIEEQSPGRFSPATLKSTAQNINSSWTKSGHLMGRAKKIRTQAQATPGSTAYALLLAHLSGLRGQQLFNNGYTALLDCPASVAMELAQAASAKGWMTFKHIGEVVEVSFPGLITAQEQEWLDEQG